MSNEESGANVDWGCTKVEGRRKQSRRHVRGWIRQQIQAANPGRTRISRVPCYARVGWQDPSLHTAWMFIESQSGKRLHQKRQQSYCALITPYRSTYTRDPSERGPSGPLQTLD